MSNKKEQGEQNLQFRLFFSFLPLCLPITPKIRKLGKTFFVTRTCQPDRLGPTKDDTILPAGKVVKLLKDMRILGTIGTASLPAVAIAIIGRQEWLQPKGSKCTK